MLTLKMFLPVVTQVMYNPILQDQQRLRVLIVPKTAERMVYIPAMHMEYCLHVVSMCCNAPIDRDNVVMARREIYNYELKCVLGGKVYCL